MNKDLNKEVMRTMKKKKKRERLGKGLDPQEEIAAQAARGWRSQKEVTGVSHLRNRAQFQRPGINWSSANAGWRLGPSCASKAEGGHGLKSYRRQALAPQHVTKQV